MVILKQAEPADTFIVGIKGFQTGRWCGRQRRMEPRCGKQIIYSIYHVNLAICTAYTDVISCFYLLLVGVVALLLLFVVVVVIR